MKRTEEFEADNLQLAAYLLAKKIPLKGVRISGRFGVFSFSKTQAETEAMKFLSGQALIEPKAYSSAIRELRAMVDQGRNTQREG